MNDLSIHIYMSQNIYTGPCKCIWQIFTLALCKCEKFEHLGVNDLHLHEIYTLYIYITIHTYMHNTDGYYLPI
jgi:hypothetical protein